jgi:thiamine kinase-like enzyme
MDTIIVRHVDMPTDTKAMTVLDHNGDYNIYINDRLSRNQREEAYRHELAHIKRGDHYRDIGIVEKETFAPAVIIPTLSEQELRKQRALRNFHKMMQKLKKDKQQLEARFEPHRVNRELFQRFER